MEAVISRRRILGLLALAGAGTWMSAGEAAAFVDPYVWPRYKSKVHFYIRGRYRYVTSNDIPDHQVGKFPDRGCPNTIRPQMFHFRMPLHPSSAGHFTPLTNRMDFGIARDGVVFDPGTADFWHHQRDSVWNFELLTGYGNLGLDQSHGHVQRDGTYHYHGLPTEFIKVSHALGQVFLIGYAADGFPIYGPWGYRQPHDSHSGIKTLRSSYRVKTGWRPKPPHGPGGRYDGKYAGDFEYVPGRGDLDQANGRYGVTPEYPHGTYYYVITESYPFVGRYFRGTPDRSFYKRPPRGGFHRPGPHGPGGFRAGGWPPPFGPPGGG